MKLLELGDEDVKWFKLSLMGFCDGTFGCYKREFLDELNSFGL
jgi:hypothetical protein